MMSEVDAAGADEGTTQSSIAGDVGRPELVTAGAPGAAPIHDEHGTLIAAIALHPAASSDGTAVADAGRTITALIRDGVW